MPGARGTFTRPVTGGGSGAAGKDGTTVWLPLDEPEEPLFVPGSIGKDGAAGGVGHSFIGYNVIGGSQENSTSNRVYAKKVTMVADGWLTTIDAYVDGGVNSDVVAALRAILYNDAAGTPDSVIGQYLPANTSFLPDDTNGVGGNLTARWVQMPVNAWLTAGDYWIGVQTGDNGAGSVAFRLFYDAIGNDRFYTSGGFWVADWGWYAPTTSANSYSIRASIMSPGGAIGPAGQAGQAGAPVYLELDPVEPDPFIVPGATGPVSTVPGPTGLAVYLETDPVEPEPFIVPGATGPPSTVAGPPGLAVYLEQDPPEADPFIVPGATGPPSTVAGPSGLAVYLEVDPVEPDLMFIPGKDGAKGADGAPGSGGGGSTIWLPTEEAEEQLWIPGAADLDNGWDVIRILQSDVAVAGATLGDVTGLSFLTGAIGEGWYVEVHAVIADTVGAANAVMNMANTGTWTAASTNYDAIHYNATGVLTTIAATAATSTTLMAAVNIPIGAAPTKQPFFFRARITVLTVGTIKVQIAGSAAGNTATMYKGARLLARKTRNV